MLLSGKSFSLLCLLQLEDANEPYANHADIGDYHQWSGLACKDDLIAKAKHTNADEDDSSHSKFIEFGHFMIYVLYFYNRLISCHKPSTQHCK